MFARNERRNEEDEDENENGDRDRERRANGGRAEDKTRRNGPLINEPDYSGVRCDLFNVTGSIQFPVELIRVALNELRLNLG